MPPRWGVAEYRPVNCFELVKVDTGVWPTESIVTGNFSPYDAGDIDRDGKADLVGEICYVRDPYVYKVLCTIESRSPDSYPDSLNWVIPDSNSASGANRRYYVDLDQDSNWEISTHWSRTCALFENVGDNRESLVYRGPPYGPRAFGDFDQNGRMDAFGWIASYHECVVECTGDNEYQVVCSLSVGRPNGYDAFAGEDADNNGKPEIFAVYDIPGVGWKHVLYMFEATAEHEYAFYAIDSFTTGDPGDGGSVCADLDGDNVDEVIWTTRIPMWILKSTGPHQFERVAGWYSDHGRLRLTICNVADFNRNGYNEIYASGEGKTSVLEVEAVRVLYPDTIRELCSGETCLVRWQIFEPPRCDSVSLFLLADTVVPEGEWFCQRTGSLRFYPLDTIVTGLAPGDTTYPWIVPDTVLEAAWIVAIAYGPGWQFDCSDRPFSIAPSGVAERNKQVAPGPLPEPTIVGDVLVWSAVTPSLRNVEDTAL
ncbi:MAG: VCBS repeat-containing protein, partial [candidate division WOR-3 bacterium]